MPAWLICLCLAFSLSLAARAGGAVSSPPGQPGAELFDGAPPRLLRLEIPAPGMESLRNDRRRYVTGRLLEPGAPPLEVRVRLKGARGSVRPLDDKPSFTLRFDDPSARFHGLRKAHLNNSVEDPSFLCEQLGAEFFRRASLPAPRVTHAQVQLNGRALGLFVLKEGFAEEFLTLHFPPPHGNLYEPVPGQDVTNSMDRRSGNEPDPQAGLRELGAAVKQAPGHEWAGLGSTLDQHQFLGLMAAEIMTGHRDGYSLARNNYRLYHDPTRDCVIFLPQGMDALFGNPTLPWQPSMSGLLARACLESPEGRRLYRQRFETLYAEVFQLSWITNWLDRQASAIRPFLAGPEAAAFPAALAGLKDRVIRRHNDLARQLALPVPGPLKFTNNQALLTGWIKVGEPATGAMDRALSPEGRPALRIQAGAQTAASWRTRVILPPGRYRFEGKASTAGVAPLPSGKSQGAMLRIRGGAGVSKSLTGARATTLLTAQFEVTNALEEVELCCELRASAGQAWFEEDSLRLARLDPASR